MNNTANILRLLIIFAIATVVQVLILDNIEILPLCNPFVYLIFLLSFPFGTRTTTLMFAGLVAGLAIDISSNTPGMHAAACIFACYLRRFMLTAISFRTAYKEDDMPSLSSYGTVWYAKYATMFVVAHHIVLFFVEQFDTLYLLPTLLRIVVSSVASVLLILLFGSLLPATHDVGRQD